MSTKPPIPTSAPPPPIASPVALEEAPDARKDVLSEIFSWSQERPAWQQDALRRLLTSGNLSAKDFDDLAAIAKSAHGLAKAKADPLKSEHVPIRSRQTAPVSILSVTHRQGVNALAPNQTIVFGPNLTVVYGKNAAGKSGYTRILKRACRSRGTENILGNILSGEAPVKPEATIRYKQGPTELPLDWKPEAAPSEALATVSVFDSHSASVYIRDRTDVAFRPFGLDIFDKLSVAAGEVRARLETEIQKLNKAAIALPAVPDSTRVKALIDSLSGLTKVEEVQSLATLSQNEELRVKELREHKRDIASSDPRQRARELRLRAERFSLLAQHLDALSDALSDVKIAELRAAGERVRIARQALAAVRKAAITANLLPETGEEQWRKMWAAASAFSSQAFPGREFPVVDSAVCPLCQQPIGDEAATRLIHFAEYVASQAHAEVQNAESACANFLSKITQLTVQRGEITLAMSEVSADNQQLGQKITEFMDRAVAVQVAVKTAAPTFGDFLPPALGSSSANVVRDSVKKLQDRAAQLEAEKGLFSPELESELRELEARIALRGGLQGVLDEIERKKRLGAYRQALDETLTTAITRKSTELTKELVTDNLRNSFSDELKKLEFTHLSVEVQAAGGSKGALFHRLVFTSAPAVAVSEVLSEGESRTLALAVFLTELSTAASKSAIIFDDPVSSLDHNWRERIARRLVAEASTRQVIVFTHDILFLRLLLDESEAQGVPCEKQYVRRETQSGICSPDLPWIAMSVKDRVGKLRVRWQEAEKTQRTIGQEAYESAAREIYGMLRETWEKAVSEVLLSEVVERYRHSIETNRLRHLHDITEEDIKTVENGMTECSRWIRGHDHPPADGTPFPNPKQLKERIDELDTWVKAIRKRREKK